MDRNKSNTPEESKEVEPHHDCDCGCARETAEEIAGKIDPREFHFWRSEIFAELLGRWVREGKLPAAGYRLLDFVEFMARRSTSQDRSDYATAADRWTEIDKSARVEQLLEWFGRPLGTSDVPFSTEN